MMQDRAFPPEMIAARLGAHIDFLRLRGGAAEVDLAVDRRRRRGVYAGRRRRLCRPGRRTSRRRGPARLPAAAGYGHEQQDAEHTQEHDKFQHVLH